MEAMSLRKIALTLMELTILMHCNSSLHNWAFFPKNWIAT